MNGDPKPAGNGWRKCPSVTTGGRAYFWFRRNPETGEREWFSWNRIERRWQYIVRGHPLWQE